MKPAEFRAAALSVPGAVEGSHQGHADFRLRGKIFATLSGPNESSGMVKLTRAQQEAFVAANAAIFGPAAGAWGRAGCTMIDLKKADKRAVRPAIRLAAENVPAAPGHQRQPARKSNRK
jgi:hypothetical protein